MMNREHATSAIADARREPPAPVACGRTGWSVLRASGPDSVEFLHGQLSSDVKSLGEGDGQHWSYNSPKGRMLANGVLWREPAGTADDGIVLLVASDLAEAIRRRLSMFVLRSKVRIEDVTERHALVGLAGGGNAGAARDALGVATIASRAVSFDEGTAFTLPDRRIAIVAAIATETTLEAALARHASPAPTEVWEWFGIASGVPWIGAATSDLFVPQMANWDLLGGVDFRKGCYPGQEIVARMQYLGKLKERLFAFHADVAGAAPATRIFSATFGPDQACGTVVNAAPDPSGGTALLAVAQLTAVEAADLTLAEPAGARLTQRPLPYEIPASARRGSRPSAG